MKNQRSGILRGIQSPETPSSSNPCQKPPTPNKRRSKSEIENVPPVDYFVSKPPIPKIRSPLPPQPPKRKFSSDPVPENGFPDSGVQVIVRMRPPNKEEEDGEQIAQKVSPSTLSILDQIFTFDSVAGTEATQQDIFQLVGMPLVENCLAGFNSSIFAYGQTGSGKTYTMWGPPNALFEEHSANSELGITPRVFERLFARIQEDQVKHADKQLNYQCRCSFLEIYNEQITDLLDPNQRNLQIREDVKSGVYVENLTEEYVCTMKDITQLLVKGLANRRVGATSINAKSSRSHSVFTCVVESRCKSLADGLSSLRTSRINLVDLAGSERQKLTGAAGERLKEAGNINRSLSQLGNLINILAEVSQSGKQRHIPYRDSRLTFLLQESLGGNAKLAMICAISPVQSCKSETFSTLRFAQRAKAIQNKAVVNEITEDDVKVLREQIRQLKDELVRMKSNGNGQTNCSGGYSTGWNARRSLNLLKMSLHRPLKLPHAEDDSDEEMEIDEEDVEKFAVQVGLHSCSQTASCSQPAGCEENLNSLQEIASNSGTNGIVASKMQSKDASVSGCGGDQGLEEIDVNMEDGQTEEMASGQMGKHAASDSHTEPEVLRIVSASNDTENLAVLTESKSTNGEPTEKLLISADFVDNVADPPDNSSTSSPNPAPTTSLSIIPCQLSPVLESPTLSISPRVDDNSSRKSLGKSSFSSASTKGLSENCKLGSQVLNLSFAQSLANNSCNGASVRASKNVLAPTESLAASLHRGMQIIDNQQQSSPLRRSSFRFSLKALDYKPFLSVDKIDIGVQTLPEEPEVLEDSSAFVCSYCKGRAPLLEGKEPSGNTELPLVPVDGSPPTEGSKKQVPKAVEKVLAGAIRREMALEEFCAKQDAEIQQLNRLVQQYKHERECNAIIEQTREEKICRLEGLMDGVLPTDEFMEEEFLSLRNEHRLLKEKYENHPEVLRENIELKRLQDELDEYKNFFDLGERDVLLEEIHDLRNQLQSYMDSTSPAPTRKRSPPPLRLTYTSEPASVPLAPIPESPEKESPEEKLKQERQRWTQTESQWISLSEELRLELEASRALVEKQKQELNSEKKCSEELKEALQMAMQGHARILDQYAELQEKHIALLARHRKIRDGITDVKQAAAKAGVKGAESRFINSLAAEISALKVEMEKERRYLRDENKGLQAQLRDTAEAVQAAGELLVRLKESEEAIAVAQERAAISAQDAKRAYREMDKLKKNHEREIATLNQFLAETRLPESALRPPPVYDRCDGERSKHNGEGQKSDQGWKEEFEPFCQEAEDDFQRTAGPSSLWFSGYDECNI